MQQFVSGSVGKLVGLGAAVFLLVGCASEPVIDAGEVVPQVEEVTTGEPAPEQAEWTPDGEPTAELLEKLNEPSGGGNLRMYVLEVHSPTEYTVAYSGKSRYGDTAELSGSLTLDLLEKRSFEFTKEGECGYEETIEYLEDYFSVGADRDSVGNTPHLADGGLYIPDPVDLVLDGYAYFNSADYRDSEMAVAHYEAQTTGKGLWGQCSDWVPEELVQLNHW